MTSNELPERTSVLIVGAGPAGLAAADTRPKPASITSYLTSSAKPRTPPARSPCTPAPWKYSTNSALPTS